MMAKQLPKSNDNPLWMRLDSDFSNPNIKARFSLKSFPINLDNSRMIFARKLGFNYQKLIIPIQTHSINVTFCNKPGLKQKCDGVFTSNAQNVCSIQVADCMPVFFAHYKENVFGLLHVGWRGLVNGILQKSEKVLNRNKYDLSDFEVIIGPSIQKCCFEIKDDIIEKFHSKFVLHKIKLGKYFVDLQNYALNNLVELGMSKVNIKTSKECTFCNTEKYHSYRRDGENAGRMFGMIGIEEPNSKSRKKIFNP